MAGKNITMWKESNKYKIILASQSPKRKELLEGLDIVFEQRVISNIDESYPNNIPAIDVPLYISKAKAEAYKGSLKQGELLITADTIVLIDDKILGKPKDRADAFNMLSLLAGNMHRVVTAVNVIYDDKQISFTDITNVYFNDISEEDINYYLDHYHPYDKAGAYGIQDWLGLRAISKIEGSFYNVMGLPVDKLVEHLTPILPV